MPEGERRLAAIMFTDMVGYTALGQRNESLSLALVEEQKKLIRPILERYNGREVKTMGDAFLVEFPNALDAVRCAYDIQRATREYNIPLSAEKRIRLRVGLHLGDVVESQGDISGDAVNVASRVEPLAEDGGVCLTRQVYDHVQNKVELTLVSLGTKPLKNVGTPVEVFKMMMPWSETSTSSEVQLDKKRVAVLPFANMSPDPSDRYFADGMTEELISTVSKISELQVISRTSVMRYRDMPIQISQIGQELSVGSVLEGSVRKAGNKVRITAQLIDVDGDKHVWSQSYDRDLTDIFAIQADIAEQVAGSLKVQLLSREKQSIRKEATSNSEAYSLYLKGRFYWHERTEEGTKKALAYFERAAESDPGFAMAYSGMADAYSILSDYGWVAPSDALPKARANATKALSIDNNLAEAHASLGLSLSNSWDLDAGEQEFKRAIEIKQNYAPAHHWYAVNQFYKRRHDESVAAMERALSLDPYSRVYNMVIVNAKLIAYGRYDEALKKYGELIETNPDMSALRYWRSTCYVLAGMVQEAVKEAEEYIKMEGGSWTSTYSNLHLAWVYASSRKEEDAEKLMQIALAEREKRSVSATGIGWVKVLLGHEEEGYAWLSKAFEERDPDLLYFNGYPWAKRVRADARWRAIEAKFPFKSVAD